MYLKELYIGKYDNIFNAYLYSIPETTKINYHIAELNSVDDISSDVIDILIHQKTDCDILVLLTRTYKIPIIINSI
jgi:hypothetical protein